MKGIEKFALVLFALILISFDSTLSNNQNKEDNPDINNVSVNITDSSQTYTLPASFYSKKITLQNTANSQIASWQNLYKLGLITATEYEQKVTEINAQLANDIAALENTYLATDIYNNVNVSFTVQNDNVQAVSVIVYIKVITTDSSQFQNYKYVSNIPSGSFLSSTISIFTSGKKYQTVAVTNIVFQ